MKIIFVFIDLAPFGAFLQRLFGQNPGGYMALTHDREVLLQLGRTVPRPTPELVRWAQAVDAAKIQSEVSVAPLTPQPVQAPKPS